MVGEYVDAAGNFHGFLWDRGRFTTIDIPGVAATSPLNINDLDQIVGAYQNPDIPPNPQGTSMQPPTAMSAALAPR